MSCPNCGYCYNLPDCDDIESEIFNLLDQYYDLYTKAYMNDYDEENSEIETAENIKNERGVATTPETPKRDQTDAEMSEKVPDKRVHFVDEPKEVPQEPKEVPQEPKKVPQKPKKVPQKPKKVPQKPKKVPQKPKEVPLELNNDITEQDKSLRKFFMDELKKGLEDYRKALESELKSEVKRHESLQEEMETVGRKYENRTNLHTTATLKMNRYGDLMCQRIADGLKRLKCKEEQYNKSPRKLGMVLMRLLPKQRELKRNEYRIIAVRNLQFKIETMETNIRRLMKAIGKENVLIQQWEFMLNPMCVKCSGHHSTSSCTKTREQPCACANCDKNHTANYRGCSYYQEMKKRFGPKPVRNPAQAGARRVGVSTPPQASEFPQLPSSPNLLPSQHTVNANKSYVFAASLNLQPAPNHRGTPNIVNHPSSDKPHNVFNREPLDSKSWDSISDTIISCFKPLMESIIAKLKPLLLKVLSELLHGF
ncbi:hypothetical protein WDU94_008644 [Cyamophila willieti]